ncbi:response regulator [Pseudomonadales bacterium]|nr:response regulator [Pseudomonadales bacterium]
MVEDEPRVLRVTLRDLKRLGYRTLEANNASMAKTMIDSGQKIDLVFSDVLMPGDIDGQMLGLWVEKNHPLIKVVLTSGFTKRKTKVGVHESSFPLLRKPYTIEALAKKMSTALFENS